MNLKREKIATVIHGIEIYNPTPKQRIELKKELIDMNGKAIKSMGENMQMLVEQGIELTDEVIQSVRTEALIEVAKKSESKQVSWFGRFTNINTGLLTNDVLDDPSQELRDVFNAINKYVIKPIKKEVQEAFDEELKNKGDKIIENMELGE